jgi:hypothetical protein
MVLSICLILHFVTGCPTALLQKGVRQWYSLSSPSTVFSTYQNGFGVSLMSPSSAEVTNECSYMPSWQAKEQISIKTIWWISVFEEYKQRFHQRLATAAHFNSDPRTEFRSRQDVYNCYPHSWQSIPSNQQYRPISGRSRGQILAWRLPILTEMFCGIPQFLQSNTEIVSQIRLRQVP